MTLEVTVSTENNTVWLKRQQMATLFDRDIKIISKYINNVMCEELEGQVVLCPERHRHNRLNITI